MRRIPPPPSEGNYTGGDEGLADADLAKSPVATGVIPPLRFTRLSD